MKCTLMHKTRPVADMVLDDATGFIRKISKLYEPAHLPVGVSFKKGVADRAALNEWWINRSIPASRSGVREALETLEIQNTQMLLTRCYGLSLSDQYWIKPSGSELKWDALNFFDNFFPMTSEMYYLAAIARQLNLIFLLRITPPTAVLKSVGR